MRVRKLTPQDEALVAAARKIITEFVARQGRTPRTIDKTEIIRPSCGAPGTSACSSGGKADQMASSWSGAASSTVKMAAAMKHAVEAGRLAFEAGRIPRKRYASASSPVDGLIARS